MENQEGSDDFFGLIFTYFNVYGTETEISASNETVDKPFEIPAPDPDGKKYSINNMYDFELNFADSEQISDHDSYTQYSDMSHESLNTNQLPNFVVTNEVNESSYSSKSEMSSVVSYVPNIPSENRMETVSQNRRGAEFIQSLQFPNEPRLHYLLRFPQLYQEYMNSSNLEKLKMLVYDVITEHCVFHIQTSPPIVGVDKIYQMQCMTLKSAPDWYVLFSKMKRIKKRIWALRSKSCGTLPYNLLSMETAKSYWNFVDMSIEKLDGFHQLQKQKYDTLISQNKMIKFERSATWYFFLNRECKKFEKVMAYHAQLEIFEK